MADDFFCVVLCRLLHRRIIAGPFDRFLRFAKGLIHDEGLGDSARGKLPQPCPLDALDMGVVMIYPRACPLRQGQSDLHLAADGVHAENSSLLQVDSHQYVPLHHNRHNDAPGVASHSGFSHIAYEDPVGDQLLKRLDARQAGRRTWHHCRLADQHAVRTNKHEKDPPRNNHCDLATPRTIAWSPDVWPRVVAMCMSQLATSTNTRKITPITTKIRSIRSFSLFM